MSPDNIPDLENILRLLEDLVAQSHAYENVLTGNAQAQIAVSALRQLASEAKLELQNVLASGNPPAGILCFLTPREREILELVSQGLANKQIAYRLGISDRTVQFHLKSIFAKTATESRTEAVVFAVKSGWILLD